MEYFNNYVEREDIQKKEDILARSSCLWATGHLQFLECVPNIICMYILSVWVFIVHRMNTF